MSIQEFEEFITSHGYQPPAITPGRWCRMPAAGKNGRNRSASCMIFDNLIGGIIWDFSTDTSTIWQKARDRPYTDEERQAFQSDVEIATIIRNEEERKKHSRAAKEAQDYISELAPACVKHPYAKTKQITPFSLLQDDQLLVMPIIDSAGDMSSYQTIDPDGKKLMKTGGKKKGCCHVIPGDRSEVYVCEGYATGATVHEATGAMVLVALDAGNIMPVVDALILKSYAKITIAADNDHHLESNVGIEKANAVREKYKNIKVISPPNLGGKKGTDWNDVHVVKGIAEVEKMLSRPVIESVTASDLMRKEFRELRWAVPGIIPEGMTVLAGRPKYGKSWLMLGLGYAVATGGIAWEYAECKKASVHYLCLEDSERRIQDRVRQMEGYFDEYPDNFHFYIDFPRINSGFLEELTAIKDRDPDCGLIIVDTLQKVKPLSKGKNTNLYQKEYEDYEAVQRWSIRNAVPVVCIHHTRKGGSGGGGNPMDEMSGSSGIQGVADTLIVCERENGKNEGKMYVSGREVGEAEYVMRFSIESMTWVVEKKASEVDTGQLMLSDHFRHHSTITVQEASRLFAKNIRISGKRLNSLVDSGHLVKEDSGTKNKKIYRPSDPMNFSFPYKQ